jgi:hypothetical protein
MEWKQLRQMAINALQTQILSHNVMSITASPN